MHDLLDILVSGVHDAKNQLFVAESIIAGIEVEHRLDLGEARYAIESAANRLSRTLATYRLLRDGGRLAITPVIVADLCDELSLAQRTHLAANGVTLQVDCQVIDEWLLDRDLLSDMLNNAVQNAGRFARSTVQLRVSSDDGWLVLRVDDDGPGFATLPPADGTGLQVAARLAQLHHLHGRYGSLRLSNESPLGGARFELHLP